MDAEYTILCNFIDYFTHIREWQSIKEGKVVDDLQVHIWQAFFCFSSFTTTTWLARVIFVIIIIYFLSLKTTFIKERIKCLQEVG